MTNGLDLTIVVGYDKHSWTAGWKHFMDGMTVFYSEWGDDQLDKSASFQAKGIITYLTPTGKGVFHSCEKRPACQFVQQVTRRS